MPKLSDFPPVSEPLDVAQLDWESGPCGQTRDSGPLVCANFDALIDRLDVADPYGKDWEIVRFGHFAVGWVEHIFVRPGTVVHDICEETRKSLAEYPCIDEGLWSTYQAEYEASQKSESEAK